LQQFRYEIMRINNWSLHVLHKSLAEPAESRRRDAQAAFDSWVPGVPMAETARGDSRLPAEIKSGTGGQGSRR
jgi:hypothetical protein